MVTSVLRDGDPFFLKIIPDMGVHIESLGQGAH